MALGRIVVDVGIVRKQFKIDSTKNSPNYIEIFFTILKYQIKVPAAAGLTTTSLLIKCTYIRSFKMDVFCDQNNQ